MKALFADAEMVLARWENVARHCHSSCNLDRVFDLASEIASQARHLKLAAANSRSCLLVVSWMVSPG